MPTRGAAPLTTFGRIALTVVVSLSFAGGPSLADTAVNTYTTGNQNRPAIATDGQGRYIVTWVSDGQDGDGLGIFGRRFDANGQPIGNEFPVNTYTTGDQSEPQVAADVGGNFVVVWKGRAGADRDDVRGRRFNATGLPISPEFPINQDISRNHRSPAVALSDDGTFLVTWSNYDRLAARHFDAFTAPTGGDFDLAIDGLYGGYFTTFKRRQIESLPSGDYLVVWHEHIFAGYEQHSIRGSVLDQDTLQITTFPLTVGTVLAEHRSPTVALTPDGGFVLAWSRYEEYGLNGEIVSRRFDATGTPQGSLMGPIPVGTTPQIEAVAAAGADRFLVIWNDAEIEGRFISATDGTPLTEPFTINTVQMGDDRDPRVASSGRNVMVAWAHTTFGGGPPGDEVVATNRFPLFSDSFESGDTASWSAALSPF